MVPADGMMGKLTPLKVEQPLLFFKDWPSPPDELTQLNLPGMVGKLVCSFNVYYGSADGLAQGITTSWARPHVLPGLNMPLGIMSTGPGLILVPSFLPTLLFFGIYYTSFPSVWSEYPARVDAWPGPVGTRVVLPLASLTDLTQLVFSSPVKSSFFTSKRGNWQPKPV